MTRTLQSKPVPVRESGVYLLILDGRIRYVGQSKFLQMRLTQHVESKAFNRVLWSPVPPRWLDAVEGAAIRYLQPPENAVVRGCRKGAMHAPGKVYMWGHGVDSDIVWLAKYAPGILELKRGLPE